MHGLETIKRIEKGEITLDRKMVFHLKGKLIIREENKEKEERCQNLDSTS